MARKGRTKRRGRIRIEQKAQLVHKNDKTTVARAKDLDTIPRMEAQMPRNAAPVFKVKLRRKQ